MKRVTIFILLCYRKVYLETWRMIAMTKGNTYINTISLESILLTPFIMKEWACALVSNIFFSHINILKINVSLQYDRSVSVSHPPSTATFDLVNHRSSLHICLQNPCCLESASTSASSQGTGISGDLAHILQIISSMVSMACIPSKPPTTPTCCCASLSASIILYVYPLRIPLQSCLNFSNTQK